MTALELKKKYIKRSQLENVRLIARLESIDHAHFTYFHVHDDEEIPGGHELYLKITNLASAQKENPDLTNETIRKDEQTRLLKYLKSLLGTTPKASLAATIDLIETTDPKNYGGDFG